MIMLKQIFEFILSKLGELIVVYALNNVNSVNEFGRSLNTLQEDLKVLSAKAYDVEEQIKKAEALGQKKRKREVEEWLVDVYSIKRKVVELKDEVEGAGFIARMMNVGKVTRLSEQVKNLVVQRRHFGELVLDHVCGRIIRRNQTSTMPVLFRTKLLSHRLLKMTYTNICEQVGKQVVVGVFSYLTTLRIQNCNEITNLGLPVMGLPNLGKIIISECKEIEYIFEVEDEGRDFVTLLKLRNLKLHDLPRLKSLCKETVLICNSIRKISINNCPRLVKKLPLHLDVPLPPALTYIWVEREWWESLEWENENPNLPRLIHPLLRFW